MSAFDTSRRTRDTDGEPFCRTRSVGETPTDLRATTEQAEQPQNYRANGWDP